MDTTLYDEINNARPNENRARTALKTKSNLAIDFADVAFKRERLDIVGLLSASGTAGFDDHELPSPELERFLLQPIEGGSVGTPSGVSSVGTPTTQILFPKSVTEEQEAYARGFVDALEELHKRQGAPNAPASGFEFGKAGPAVVIPGSDVQPNNFGGLNPIHRQMLPTPAANFTPTMGSGVVNELYSATVHHMFTVEQRPDNVVASGRHPGTDWGFLPTQRQPTFYSGNTMMLGSSFQEFTSHHNQHTYQHPSEQQKERKYLETMGVQTAPTREEPQTVPRLGDTPPLSPINPDDQDRAKLERKRARNRMAARKCRTRKLEQIALLEERIVELKGRNGSLARSAMLLRDHVTRLERHLNEHVQNSVCLLHSQTQTPHPAAHYHPFNVVSNDQYTGDVCRTEV